MQPPFLKGRRGAARQRRTAARGFALPLALIALAALSLLTAILLDEDVHELRAARGDMALARAEAAAETALADLLAAPADSGLLNAARGSRRDSAVTVGSATVRLELQGLGGAICRLVVAASASSGENRAAVRNVVFLRLRPDSGVGATGLRYQRLPGWWWAPAQ